jgi:DNA-binding NarL/FixJ family response regulator
MSTRILLADDHSIMREGLRLLLERDGDMEVVAEAEDGREAVRLAIEMSPHVVIMDIGMPELNGIEATRKIADERPATKVIVLSMHTDKRYVAAALKAGAAGYIWKNGCYKELRSAVQSVMNGQRFLSPAIATSVVDDYVDRLSQESSLTSTISLSPREREVLQLLTEGLSSKEIAAKLGLSSKTVDVHRKQIMDKLGIHSVAELTKFAIREGITPLE